MNSDAIVAAPVVAVPNSRGAGSFVYVHVPFDFGTDTRREDVKIGGTDGIHERYKGKCTDLGPCKYHFYPIKILEVPEWIKRLYPKKTFKLEMDKKITNYMYAEKHVQQWLGEECRIRSPSAKRLTEFFNYPNCQDKESEDIRNEVCECLIKAEFIIDKNFPPIFTADDLNKSAYKPYKKKTTNKPKQPKPTTTRKPEQAYSEYLENPQLFIERVILFGKELRQLQKKLLDDFHKTYNKLKTDLEKGKSKVIIIKKIKKTLNGIIKWPTGYGKTIAIIIWIIYAYKFTLLLGKTFTSALITNRNDIFDGKPFEKYQNLEKFFGIKIFKGFKNNFSKIKEEVLGYTGHYLLIATHQAVVRDDGENTNLESLQIDNHIYDEVHHITGPKIYDYYKKKRLNINLAGVSATPFTNDESGERLEILFKDCGPGGDGLLSNVTIDNAIDEGVINDFEISVFHYKNPSEIITCIGKKIEDRKKKKLFKKNKFIIVVPENKKERDAFIKKLRECTDWAIYEDKKIKQFQTLQAENTSVLITCRKCREGWDARGIEFAVCIGNSAPFIYIQLKGRADRKDYDGQLSELLIFNTIKNDQDSDREFLVLRKKLFKKMELSENDDRIQYRKIEDVCVEDKAMRLKKEEIQQRRKPREERLRQMKEKLRLEEEEHAKATRLEEEELQKHEADSESKFKTDNERIIREGKEREIKQFSDNGEKPSCHDFIVELNKNGIVTLKKYKEYKKKHSYFPDNPTIHYKENNFNWYEKDPQKDKYYDKAQCIDKIQTIKRIYENELDDIYDNSDRLQFLHSKDKKIPDLETDLDTYYGGELKDFLVFSD